MELNTVERIAASSEILKSIRTDKALVFAATHDVELTSLLRGKYDNYHFRRRLQMMRLYLISSCIQDLQPQEMQ